MKLQTASGAVLTPATRTRLNHGSSTRGSAVRMDSPLPLRSPAVSLRYFIRRGIGGSVLDRSANATRDFSEQSGAFRGSADDSTTVGGVTPLRRPLANGGTLLVFHFSRSPERLSTLPGQVASGHLTSWGALPFPIHGRSISTKGGATNSPHISEIAAGRSIGPSRRPNNIVAFPVARDHAAGD